MSAKDKCFEGLIFFRDKSVRELRFIRLLSNENILCWHIRDNNMGDVSCFVISLPPERVNIGTLKSIGVWDSLTEEKRLFLESSANNNDTVSGVDDNGDNGDNGGKDIQEGHLSKGSKAKKVKKSRDKYNNLPRSIQCSNCKCSEDIIPGQLYKKLDLNEEMSRLEQEAILKPYVVGYKCSKCVPRRRGRLRNPLFNNIPKKTHCCKCGKEILLASKNVYDITGGDTVKIKEYCSSYLCRSCNPESGSWLKGKRGRKPKNVLEVVGNEQEQA
jgi:hypothetical protein